MRPIFWQTVLVCIFLLGVFLFINWHLNKKLKGTNELNNGDTAV